jgi:hypothetical protein
LTENADAQLPRILVVAPPKSGSTYVSNVVRRYFDIPEVGFPSQIDWEAEHNVNPWLFLWMRGKSFCFNLHMVASRINLEVARTEHMGLVGLWRNLGDVIVSLDEHIVTTQENGPMYYIRDKAKYAVRPAEERYSYLIDTVVSWYLTFYLRWRGADLALHPYEEMLRDRHAFFAELLAPLLSHPPIDELIDTSLGVKDAKKERVNVGRAGRSAAALAEPNRRQLERMVWQHPDAAQLEVLLWELPWRPPDLEPVLPLDGAVVRAEGDDPTLYFVSRGVRYPVSRTSWLASRSGALRTPRVVPDATLAPYRLGEPLD